MGNWLKITILLSSIGFLRDFRPSDAFIFVYLTGSWKHFSNDQVNQHIFPIGAYSNAICLIAMFFLTDICRYKPLIILMGFAGTVTWSLLIWSETLQAMQFAEVFYGLFMATEVAFRSYIYTKVVTDDYQKVTGLLKAASLAGKLCSGIVSQLLVTFKIMDYMQLNYITLISMLIMMVMSFKLPNVQHSVYFNKKSDATIPDENQTFIEKLHKASNMFRLHLSQFRTNRTLQKFSIFWIINLAMFLQMNTYMQSLWKDIVSDPTVPIYNGFVTAVYRILGIIVSLSVTCIRFDLKNKTFPLMLFFWLLQGSLLVVTSQVTNLISSYICYVSYAIIYQFLITILTSEIAKCIVNDSYGLVFSTNTFVALCLQLVLIHVFVKNHFSANFSIQMQYFLYGSVHFVLAFLIVIVVLIRCFSCNHHNVNNYNDTSDSSNEYNDFEAANKVLQETEIF